MSDPILSHAAALDAGRENFAKVSDVPRGGRHITSVFRRQRLLARRCF
jgi:hypothetical protein